MSTAQGTLSDNTTRSRIVLAARRRFAQAAYEEVGLRDISADIDVDISYVHRCFGSKENLFVEALKASDDGHILTRLDLNDIAGSLVREILGRARARQDGEISAIDIILRSLTSPKASSILRDIIPSGFVLPLADKLGDDDLVRASAVTATLLGFGILHNLMPALPSFNIRDNSVAKALTTMIASITSADTGDKLSARPRRRLPRPRATRSSNRNS